MNSYMWYKGSRFHRINSQKWICGGDILNMDGTGNQTIYEDGLVKTIDFEQNMLIPIPINIVTITMIVKGRL